MTEEEKEKVYRLCYQSVTGRRLDRSRTAFLGRMHKKDPEEYRRIHTAAKEEAMAAVNPLAGRPK